MRIPSFVPQRSGGLRAALAALALIPVLATPAPAQTAAEGQILARAMAAAQSGNWSEAQASVGQIANQPARDVITWLRLRDGAGSWAEYQDFLNRNQSWPGLAPIRRHAERAMPDTLSPGAVVSFFGAEGPVSGTGALKLANALVALGRNAEAGQVVVRAWREMSMTGAEQAALNARFGSTLAAHHTARLDMLLWRGLTAEANAMLPLVDAGWQALARARIGLRQDVSGTTQLINAVPASLQGDPGLAYERFLWRINRGNWEDAEAWLLQHSTSAERLGRPEMWMERRPGLVRRAMRRGDHQTAYRLAAMNFGSEGSDYADSEWLAGYIALMHLGDPNRALQHFQRFRAAVFTPISLGRAGFWIGLAAERAGNQQLARQGYQLGAQHQTSFYGQLAAQRGGIGPDRSIAGTNRAPNWRSEPFMRWSVVQAAYYLHLAGDANRTLLFMTHAANQMPAAQRAALAQMAIDIGRPHIGIRIAKNAAAEGIILIEQYYPVTDLARNSWGAAPELVMAIARQESELNPAAVSPAGARGIMQVMPATAEVVARQLGLPYNQAALTSDPNYNARLGAAYIQQMLQRYGGSYILAAAAYNAGPSRVDQWIRDFGDPRRPEVDPVVWIESIPFNETRNYVMRVMEGLHVYRARLNGAAGSWQIVQDINRSGG